MDEEFRDDVLLLLVVVSQLRAAVSQLRDENMDMATEAKKYAEEAGCLAALLLDAQRDAQRYRRIRRGQHWSVINGVGDELRADVLDAAIDAAIAKEKGAQG
ncbi:hypothetical protein XALC_0200 [Xanthomonas albilineans GPE PC73]|uniref:Uncharacterized protein n=2 Tax=Xanthomonas albilineans TaxID=29447 RepID=D2U942_XANAP|nr:hypothetical protein XALC_0200 [Xanthomonas albilineans GPE PC73]